MIQQHIDLNDLKTYKIPIQPHILNKMKTKLADIIKNKPYRYIKSYEKELAKEDLYVEKKFHDSSFVSDLTNVNDNSKLETESEASIISDHQSFNEIRQHEFIHINKADKNFEDYMGSQNNFSGEKEAQFLACKTIMQQVIHEENASISTKPISEKPSEKLFISQETASTDHSDVKTLPAEMFLVPQILPKDAQLRNEFPKEIYEEEKSDQQILLPLPKYDENILINTDVTSKLFQSPQIALLDQANKIEIPALPKIIEESSREEKMIEHTSIKLQPQHAATQDLNPFVLDSTNKPEAKFKLPNIILDNLRSCPQTIIRADNPFAMNFMSRESTISETKLNQTIPNAPKNLMDLVLTSKSLKPSPLPELQKPLSLFNSTPDRNIYPSNNLFSNFSSQQNLDLNTSLFSNISQPNKPITGLSSFPLSIPSNNASLLPSLYGNQNIIQPNTQFNSLFSPMFSNLTPQPNGMSMDIQSTAPLNTNLNTTLSLSTINSTNNSSNVVNSSQNLFGSFTSNLNSFNPLINPTISVGTTIGSDGMGSGRKPKKGEKLRMYS